VMCKYIRTVFLSLIINRNLCKRQHFTLTAAPFENNQSLHQRHQAGEG